MTFWRKALTITWKDVIAEMRSKETIISILVFTFLAIIVFNFALGGGLEATKEVAPAILWITFAFAGILSFNRSFVLEKEENCLEGLMVCPISREAIYVGKMLGSLLFMLIVEIIALLVFTALFNLPIISLQIITITFLTTVGFVSVGILFSAIAVNTKAREMVLPILFLPIVVPLIISAVKASTLAILDRPWAELSSWLNIIGAFDVIFIAVSFLIFSFVIEE